MRYFNLLDYKDRQYFYRTRQWLTLRELVLQEEPLCRSCKAKGIIEPANEVDHIISIVTEPKLYLTRSNLQSLCHDCHSKKTFNENTPPTTLTNRKWKVNI